MKAAFSISLFVLVVVGYTAVSTSDYYEAQRQHEHCLDMTAQGAWPKAACKEY